VASLTALTEKDAKKVVALSTLRQLGIIFISLRLGNSMICLFHVLIHALAKANLFIVVGELLHKRFAQQDIRYLVQGGLSKTLFLSKLISIVRLTGLVFSSGFFSKEQIITSQYSEITRILS
jgi:NADH:ubiquinone oxidoreductase subunit 5 (subunit L)/multisubunit Na+/H+ antiporter MnhA subunit